MTWVFTFIFCILDMTFFNKSNNSFTLFYTCSTQVSNQQSPGLISDYLCGKGDVPSQTITFFMYMLILDKYKLMQLFRFFFVLWSMKETIERYSMHSRNLPEVEPPSLELQVSFSIFIYYGIVMDILLSANCLLLATEKKSSLTVRSCSTHSHYSQAAANLCLIPHLFI